MADAAGSRGRWLRGDHADVVLAVVVGVFVVFTTVVRWDPQVSVAVITEGLLLAAMVINVQASAALHGLHRDPSQAAESLAACRIVQEALTNVTRHAGAGKVVAEVRIERARS